MGDICRMGNETHPQDLKELGKVLDAQNVKIDALNAKIDAQSTVIANLSAVISNLISLRGVTPKGIQRKEKNVLGLLLQEELIAIERGTTHCKHTQNGDYDEYTDPAIYLVGKASSVPAIKRFLEKETAAGNIDIGNIDAFMIKNIKRKDKNGKIKDIKNTLQAYKSRKKSLQKLTNA